MDRVKDDILGKMSYEDVENLDYVRMCYQESMRFEAPLAGTATSKFSRDVSINGVDFHRGEAFFVMIYFVHRDPAQWHHPDRFIPERFDCQNPQYYLTPAGRKRKAFAFSPFLGGSRVCMGKTFAEITLKFVLPLWYHAFTFEFVKDEHKAKQPFVHLAAPKAEKIPVRLTTRNKI